MYDPESLFALQVDGTVVTWGGESTRRAAIQKVTNALKNVTYLDPNGAGALSCTGDSSAIDDVGCCDGNAIWRRGADGKLAKSACAANTCGWNGAGYSYMCGTGGTPSPGLRPPRTCVCVPNCDGKQCGSDGCGGTCDKGSCDDGDGCTSDDACTGESCVGKPGKACDDNNACTDDSCTNDKGKAVCKHTANAGKCDDGDKCSLNDTCKDSKCAAGAAKLDCDDGDDCTVDSCDKAKGCAYSNGTGKCEDGSKCTAGETCKDGICGGTKEQKCRSANDGQALTLTCPDNKRIAGILEARYGQFAFNDPCNYVSLCGNQDLSQWVKDSCVGKTSCTLSNYHTVIGDPCPGKAKGIKVRMLCPDASANPPIKCDDANPCTDDSCDAKTGCVFKDNTKACDDGSSCTTGTTCKGGKCQGGTGLDCDDNNPCTVDDCDTPTKCAAKVNVKDGQKCSDGNKCHTVGACKGGKCDGIGNVVCNDSNVCTNDSCDPKTGCVYTANTAACNDNNTCTTNDTCAAKVCKGGKALDCDDGNACTNDACAKATGCVYTNNTAACDDGSVCTQKDACAAGKCAGSDLKSCEDGNICTGDRCNAVLGCQHAFRNVACDDGNTCTFSDACQEGACKGGIAPACNDGNPCTDDGCDAKTGCSYKPNNAPCDDGNACTLGDQCGAGGCVKGPQTRKCDDGNLCTNDVCNPAKGCVHVFNAVSCDDGSACTVGDACKSGKCAGSPKTCDDGNFCTNDGCDPKTGCTIVANSAPCDDGNICTTVDVCKGGACTGTGKKDCDDGNICTVDHCFPQSGGCWHYAWEASGTPCDDGNVCTHTDTCYDGKCSGKAQCNGYGCKVVDGKATCSCGAGRVEVSNNGVVQCCTPQCDYNKCGDDGCGGSCGTCTNEENCKVAGQVWYVDYYRCLPKVACYGKAPVEVGCCDGRTVRTCYGINTLQSQDCKAKGLYCGWDSAKQRYGCTVDGAPKPGGDPPFACPNTTCTPDCKGRACGPDGCGGTCGSCGEGQVCVPNLGKCYLPCEGKALMTGCVQKWGTNDVVTWCPAPDTKESDALQFGCFAGQVAGWDKSKGRFTCTGTDETPKGVKKECPKVCSCGIGLFAKECSDDGCGNKCGQGCTKAQVCTTAGKCCTPNCKGKVCGDDGCGGVCGTCSGGLDCSPGGQCALKECFDVNVTSYGTCSGNAIKYCSNNALVSKDCGAVGLGCGLVPQGKMNTCIAPTGQCAAGQCVKGTAGCRCDAGCVEAGSCCNNFDLTCGASVVKSACGDKTCRAEAGETCATCPADCGACTKGSGIADSPYPQRILDEGGPGARRQLAIAPLDDVRPSPPAMPLEGLVNWAPGPGLSLGNPRSTNTQSKTKWDAKGSGFETIKGVDGEAFGGMKAGEPTFGAIATVPEATLPRPASYANRSRGGMTVAAWVKVPKASLERVNPLAYGSTAEIPGKTGYWDSRTKETCWASRPGDSAIHLKCPPSGILGEWDRIVEVQAYYGDVGGDAFPTGGWYGVDCDQWRKIPKTRACEAKIDPAWIKQRCVWGSCTLDPWSFAKDPCTKAPHKPMKSQLLVRAICAPFQYMAPVNLQVQPGGQLELRFDPNRLIGNDTKVLVRSNKPIPADEWVHVALTFEPRAPGPASSVQGGHVVMYINGDVVGTGMPSQLPPMWRWSWGGGWVEPFQRGGKGDIYKSQLWIYDNKNHISTAALADFDDLFTYDRGLPPKAIRGLYLRPQQGLARVFPPVTAEVAVADQLWTTGGKLSLTPVQATQLRDPGQKGSGATLEAEFSGVSLSDGAVMAMPADGKDLDDVSRWTLGAWIRPKTVKAGTTLLELRQGDKARVKFAVDASCDGTALQVTFADGKTATTGCDHGLAAGRWTFIAAVQSNSSRRVSLDGYGTSAVGPGTLFDKADTAARTLRLSSDAALGWAALYSRDLSRDSVRAARAQGPDVWIDGKVWQPTGTNEPMPRDYAGFSNQKPGIATEQPVVRVEGKPLTSQPGNFQQDTQGKGYITIPAVGRLAALQGPFVRRFSVVESVRITTNPTKPTRYPLVQLTHKGEVVAQAELECAPSTVDGTLPSTLFKTAIACSVAASWRIGKLAVHQRYVSAPILINASKLDVHVRAALTFGNGIKVRLGVGGLSGQLVALTTATTLNQGSGWIEMALKPHVTGPAPPIPAGAGTGIHIPGYRPTTGFAGVWDVRVYGRALSQAELSTSAQHGCEAIGCASQRRTCQANVVPDVIGPSITSVAACGGCVQGKIERNGACIEPLVLMTKCVEHEECATGYCNASGQCADKTASTACKTTCLSRGKKCEKLHSGGFGCTFCEIGFSSKDFGSKGTCSWAPPLKEDQPCTYGHECDSGVCAERTTAVYGVTSDATTLTQGRFLAFTSGGKNFYGGPWYQCADKAGCAVPAATSKKHKACAAKTVVQCDDLNMASRVVKATRWDGQKVTTYMCDGCSKEQYEGKALFKQSFSMMSPEACKTIYDNYHDLQATDSKGRKGVWVGNQFYVSAWTGDHYVGNIKGEPTPYAKGNILEQEPTMAIMRRLLLKDPNPTSYMTPKIMSQLQKAGAGNEVLGWARLPFSQKQPMRRTDRIERWQNYKQFFITSTEAMPIGACNMASYKFQRGSHFPNTYKSPFFNAAYNRPICVPNKFPNGTVCPPPGKEAQFPRSHAGEICDSGFCAYDTGVCEDGYRRYEEDTGSSRNDGQSGGSGNDLGAIALNQDNGGMFRFDDVDTKKVIIPKGTTDRRHYLVEGHSKESLSLFGTTLDVLDFSILLTVAPGAAQTKDKASYKQEFLILGIQPPSLPALPTASCGSPQWKDGQYTGASCGLTRKQISIGVEAQAGAPESAGNNTAGNDKVGVGAGGGEEGTDNLVDAGSVTLAEFDIPLPLQECPQNLKGFATVIGKACFAKETQVGPVPFKVEAELAPSASLSFGAELDSDTLEPAAVVKPAIGFGVEVKGGIGKEIGPLEIFAGIKAAITIIQIALPVKFAIGFAQGTKQVGGSSQSVTDLWVIKKSIISELELSFLQLALAVFFDVGISPITVSLEHEFFSWDGITLTWTLGQKVSYRYKVDFKWDPLGPKHPSGAP